MISATELLKLGRALCAPLGISFAAHAVRQAVEQDQLQAEAASHLNGSELVTFRALRSGKRRAEFCAGRIAAKQALADAFPQVNIRGIEICRAANGAPTLGAAAASQCTSSPHISISHSGAWAVAVVANRPVGVDLEEVAPRPDALVRYFFSDNESRRVASLAPAERGEAINRLWTRKEAACKVRQRASELSLRDIDCMASCITIAKSHIQLWSSICGNLCLSVAVEVSTLDVASLCATMRPSVEERLTPSVQPGRDYG